MIKTALFTIGKSGSHEPEQTSSEPVVSELCRGLEGLEPQCLAGVSSLFGAIQRSAADRPAQVDQGVGCAEGR